MARYAFGIRFLISAAAALIFLALPIAGSAAVDINAVPNITTAQVDAFSALSWTTGPTGLILITLGSAIIAAFAGWRYMSALSVNRQLHQSHKRLADKNETLEAQVERRALELSREVEEHKHSQQFAETFFKQSQSLNMIAEFDGKILRLNSAWEDTLGYDPRNRTDVAPSNLLHPDDRQNTANQFKLLIAGENVDGFENRWICENGGYRHLRWSARTDPDRRLIYAVAQDVTEKKTAENALKLNASVFTFAHEGIFIADATGRFLDVNGAFTDITGYGLSDLHNKNAGLLHPETDSASAYRDRLDAVNANGVWRGDVNIRKKDGQSFPALLTLSAVEDESGQVDNYIGLFSDITKLKNNEKALEKLARHDKLTGLPNRDLLADRLTQAMARARRHDLFIAVAFIDLDGFKAVNDTYGHSTGDALLVAIARRLKAALRIEDTLARIGGDEFVAIITDLHHERDCVGTLERILRAASEQFILGPITTSVTASIGVAFYPQDHAISGEQLERQADQAMYEAKLAGRNRYRFFDPDKDKALATYHTQVAEAQTALEKNEFRLFYQPKADLETGLIIGCEALLRWQHPDRGLLVPQEFLPPIRKHPALALAIGNWVLDQTLRQLQNWQKQGLDLNVSVNLSGLQVMAPDFKEVLHGHLDRHTDITPEHLEIEFVESDVLLDISTMKSVIESCQDLGVRFALDDFGAGYSSLTCLKHLPLNTLKIHQDLVRGSPENLRDQEILKTIISMGRVFNLDILAEGIETDGHTSWLRKHGCRYGQGNAIAEPMAAQELPDWYSRQINNQFAGPDLQKHSSAS
ncbi:EAL domain-containing protein [Labrenzia sp. PHM005]|uniref:sensor domain-containing protein n=1 Tax=Labrenzia sp. PHM005 TaxID=2590016 RepID=UPI0011406CB4|nr:EAL domain-containing protein [Labrenzia sp. PHM005]QDG78463.1 EAL domain-containing protein [Labrenzia sp. PHM005]